MRDQHRTPPLGAVLPGAVAGAAGTVALDLVGFARYRRGGGETRLRDWEFSAGLSSWDDAPAPAIVGKRLAERVLGREIPARDARLVSNVTHWGYGMTMGALYGVLASTRRTVPPVPAGLAWGATVWASSYVTLPLAGVYQPIWKYDVKTLADDLTAHLAFGVVTAATFALLR
jgi:hypothetical protein